MSMSRTFKTVNYEQALELTVRLGDCLPPDHDTLATFRRTFLPELKDLFVQVLLLAQEAGVLKLGTISLDGTKVHADASKRKAVSYKRLLEVEIQLRAEVEELFTRAEQSEQPEVTDGLVEGFIAQAELEIMFIPCCSKQSVNRLIGKGARC